MPWAHSSNEWLGNFVDTKLIFYQITIVVTSSLGYIIFQLRKKYTLKTFSMFRLPGLRFTFTMYIYMPS